MRTILPVLAGAVAGTAAVALWFGAARVPESGGTPESGPGGDAALSLVAATSAFGAHMAAYEYVQATGDPDRLLETIENTALETPSSIRDAHLEALLVGLAETDPSAAVALAGSLRLEDTVHARLFQIWAVVDSDAALEDLHAMPSGIRQRAVALALLDVFGNDAEGIATIGSQLSEADSATFEFDAIALRVRQDRDAALEAALGLEYPTQRNAALLRVAEVMATLDPYDALERAGRLSVPQQRQLFLERVLDTWAKADPEAVLSYFMVADLGGVHVNPAGFTALAAADPAGLLAAAERLPAELRASARRAAIELLSATDPASAYARLSVLPPQADRDDLVQIIARRFVESDPRAAVLWATSLNPRSETALNTVLASVALSDVTLVADIVVAEILDPVAANRAGSPDLTSLLAGAMSQRSPQIIEVADRLALENDPRIRAELRRLVERWPQYDPTAAMLWAEDNFSVMDIETAEAFANRLAARDPSLAKSALETVPESLRARWIAGAASGMAATDPAAAMNWIQDFSSEPVYGSVVDVVVQSATRRQPEEAARLLDLVPPESRSRLAPNVATAFAGRDPAAAAEWITSLSGIREGRRAIAVGNVAERWGQSDLEAATTWALGLPGGATRDAALAGSISAAAETGDIDARLIESFSSGAARANALTGVMRELGRRNLPLGRRLIATHISDPTFRAQAEEQLRLGCQSVANSTNISQC